MCQSRAAEKEEGSLTAQIASTVISSPGPYSAPYMYVQALAQPQPLCEHAYGLSPVWVRM